jgi:hypothetical protein
MRGVYTPSVNAACAVIRAAALMEELFATTLGHSRFYRPIRTRARCGRRLVSGAPFVQDGQPKGESG